MLYTYVHLPFGDIRINMDRQDEQDKGIRVDSTYSLLGQR